MRTSTKPVDSCRYAVGLVLVLFAHGDAPFDGTSTRLNTPRRRRRTFCHCAALRSASSTLRHQDALGKCACVVANNGACSKDLHVSCPRVSAMRGMARFLLIAVAHGYLRAAHACRLYCRSRVDNRPQSTSEFLQHLFIANFSLEETRPWIDPSSRQ